MCEHSNGDASFSRLQEICPRIRLFLSSLFPPDDRSFELATSMQPDSDLASPARCTSHAVRNMDGRRGGTKQDVERNLFQSCFLLQTEKWERRGESDQSVIRTESFDKEKVQAAGGASASSSGLLFSLFLPVQCSRPCSERGKVDRELHEDDGKS